jgi:hypothetical protein
MLALSKQTPTRISVAKELDHASLLEAHLESVIGIRDQVNQGHAIAFSLG